MDYFFTDVLGFLLVTAFLSIPVIGIVNWIVKLVKYCKAKKANKTTPDTYSAEEMKYIKSSFIISSVVGAVLVGIYVGLDIMFTNAIAHM